METGQAEFTRQLRELGYEVQVHGSRCVVQHAIATGRLKGSQVRLGFDVPPEFPRTPPSGPHLSPGILPVNTDAPAHPQRVHGSDFGSQFGGEWIYLSRPLHGWRGSEPVSKVLAHVDQLLETV